MYVRVCVCVCVWSVRAAFRAASAEALLPGQIDMTCRSTGTGLDAHATAAASASPTATKVAAAAAERVIVAENDDSVSRVHMCVTWIGRFAC
jgi:hypothetical protein